MMRGLDIRVITPAIAASQPLSGCSANTSSGSSLANVFRPSVLSAATSDLLYVSNGAYVLVYDFPSGAPYMLLNTNWSPAGMCVDRGGGVWVTQTGGAEIVRFLHGGKTIVSTLHDPGPGVPFGCAVANSTGDVAVTNYAGKKQGQPGSVVIFPNAADNAHIYQTQDLFFYFFCTYDDDGDLFVDGQDKKMNVVIDELPKGGTQFRKLAIDGLPATFHYPGAIVWQGGKIVLADYNRGAVYHLRQRDSRAVVDGTTQLVGANGIDEIAITAATNGLVIVAANNQGTSAMAWKYPEGEPFLNIYSSGYFPVGVAISSPSGIAP